MPDHEPSWKTYLLAFLTFGLVGSIFAMVAFTIFFVPSLEDFTHAERGETSIIYDRTGEHVLYQVHGEENRKPLLHDEIPATMRLATIAVEDENFFRHPGVDTRAIFRALRVNLERGGYEQGASTITQQLARSVLLSREKTVERKITEIFLSIKIEFALSKEEILDRYLNEVPYGSNAYGIQAASETFFGKDAKDLTLGEAALLAALPNAPTLLSPYGDRTDELVARQETIIRKLRTNGWVTAEQADAALQEKAFEKVIPLRRKISAPHFVFYVLEELERKYGKEALSREGYHIYTTLDWDAQMRAETAVLAGATRNAQWNASNAALVAIDAEKAEVLAMVGSKDYFDPSIDGEVNVATAPRQPGSSFKPLVYARAFEKGYQPETLLFDVPMSFGPDGSGREYRPSNYDGRTHGLLSMRQALSNSLNIPAVQTQYLAGIDSTLTQVEKMGLTIRDRNRFGLSLVLGAPEVSLLEMTGAYGVFSQEGLYRKPSGILRVEDRYHQALWKPDTSSGTQVISAETSRKISSILSDNKARAMVFGSNSPLAFPEGGVAAKTGTTQEFRDAWTLGFSRRVAVGVWVGNNDNSPMRAGADGVFVAAPIWRGYMDYLLARFPPAQFTEYAKVESQKPMLTGRIPGQRRTFESAPQNSKERKRQEEYRSASGGIHSILYYVNRDEPLSDKEPIRNDPMLARFEAALQRLGDNNKDDDKDDDDDD